MDYVEAGATDSVRLYNRVYNDAGTRIFTDTTMFDAASPFTETLRTRYETMARQIVTNADSLRTFGLGWPTYGGSARTGEPAYMGCFAVDTAGWIGDTLDITP